MTSPNRQKEAESIAREGSFIARKYRVESILGHGGMGVVVAATHRRLGQRVAIKILYPSAARNPEAIARFLREAQAAASLQNEHVVRVLDFGRHDNTLPFMVMEYLVGTNLAELLTTRGPLPVDEAIQYVMQSSEAVAEAHARGIVHRDIKPANLFLTCRSDGSPLIKVLDFGISKADWMAHSPDYSPDLTATADTLGTPIYMSPEQVRSTKNVTCQADIWALGVVLYELLAATPPFWAESLPALSAKIVADSPVPLSSLRADLPQGLEAVVMSCLEKDPARRPASMLEIAQVLAPMAPHVTQGWTTRIEHILQQSRLPNPTAGRPSVPVLQTAEAHAWGATQAFRRNLRGGLLGLALGASLALVALAIGWLASTRGGEENVAASASAGSASAIAAVMVTAPPASGSVSALATAPMPHLSDAGNDGTSPATVSSAEVVPSAKPTRSWTGVPRSDPLGDRY